MKNPKDHTERQRQMYELFMKAKKMNKPKDDGKPPIDFVYVPIEKKGKNNVTN